MNFSALDRAQGAEEYSPVAGAQPEPRRATLERNDIEVPREWVGGQVLNRRSNDSASIAVGESTKVPLSATAQFNVIRHRRLDKILNSSPALVGWRPGRAS